MAEDGGGDGKAADGNIEGVAIHDVVPRQTKQQI
jgi:hypothetical protein